MRPPHAGSRLVRRRRRRDMRAFFYSLLGYFLTPWGIILMGALDSSLIFFLPLGIDFAVIILAARKPRTVLALCDSRDGRLGHRRHGHVLDRPQGRRTRADAADEAVAARTRAVTAYPIMPASASPRWRSFRPLFHSPRSSWPAARSAVTPGRSSPRSRECAPCAFSPRQDWPAIYGRRILTWMQSTVFEVIVGTLIVLAIVGTVISGIAVVRSTRRPKRQGAATFRS